MTKRKVSGIVTVLLTAILAVCATGLGVSTAHAEETTPDAQVNVGGIVFNSEDFDYAEGKAAFVDAARVLDNESYLFDPEKKQHKVRLDDGKEGLLLKTKKTGDSADGTSFGFANKMKGDFDIDFRVFSEETYAGKTNLSAMNGILLGASKGGENSVNRGNAENPNFNPFADVRTLSFTFTSVSDPNKSFTVYIDSHGTYATMSPTARVHIGGESFRNAGRKGYGISYNNSGGCLALGGYADFTPLFGTSFTNVAFDSLATDGTSQRGRDMGSPESYSNRIMFDIDTMCVYAKTCMLDDSDGYDGTVYKEKDVLIRNLAHNTETEDGTGTVLSNEGMGHLETLKSEDFENGYTVTVKMEDITANETVLNAATSDATDAQSVVVYTGDTKVKKLRNAYERTGKMIIYSVNGQDMRVDKGFTATASNSHSFTNESDDAHKGYTVTGYTYTAIEKNTEAEGNSFTLTPDGFIGGDGVFQMGITAISTKYMGDGKGTTFKQGNSNANAYYYDINEDTAGMGEKAEALDPYSDVKELGVTFRSKTDPSKAFTVYIASRGLYTKEVTARVGVEGEAMRNPSGLKGYADGKGGWQSDFSDLACGGTLGGGSNVQYGSWHNEKQPYVMFRFNATAMKIEALRYNTWNTVRDLTKQGLGGNKSAQAAAKTLQASDFAGGYTVTVSVERMNRKENRGIENINKISRMSAGNLISTNSGYDITDGHVVEEYDRKCEIRVIKLTNNSTIADNETSNYGAKTKYDGGREYLDIGNTFSYAYDGTAIKLPVKLGNLGAGKAIGTVNYKHASDGNTTALTVTDGTAQFNPTKSGVYTFSSGALTARLTVTAATPFSASLNNGVSATVRLDSGGKLPATNTSDIVTAGSFACASTQITYKKKSAGNSDFVAYGDYTAGATAEDGAIYKIIYTATDTDGKTATVERQVIVGVPDTAEPEIAWNSKPSYLDAGEVWTTAALTVTDNVDNSITATVTSATFTPAGGTATALTVTENTSITLPDTDGSVTINVSASDSAGNTGTATYTLDVYTGDGPTIALKEGVESSVNATEGDDFTVAITDAVVSSNWENTVTFAVRLNGGAYTYEEGQKLVVGLYEITYTVTDKFGKSASVTRQIVAAMKDVTAPVIAWSNKPAYIRGGTTFTLDDITAQDDVDASVSVQFVSALFTPSVGEPRTLTYDNGIVLPTEDGVLTINVSVTDSAGNTETEEFTVAILKNEPVIDGGDTEIGTNIGNNTDRYRRQTTIILSTVLPTVAVLLLGSAAFVVVRRYKAKKNKKQ